MGSHVTYPGGRVPRELGIQGTRYPGVGTYASIARTTMAAPPTGSTQRGTSVSCGPDLASLHPGTHKTQLSTQAAKKKETIIFFRVAREKVGPVEGQFL